MKTTARLVLPFATLLLGATPLLVGCATTGSDRATKTTHSMQKVEADYKEASDQIDATRASLEELVKPSQTDTKSAFAVYSKNVTKMEDVGDRLVVHTDQMRSRGNDYFAEWESSYTNPEIRELSERRRIEMRQLYAGIPEASIGVMGALKSYLTDIREIQRYLSNDLTAPGVEAIRPTAEKAVRDGDGLKEAIRPVLNAVDRVKSEMAQGGTNQAPASGGDRK